MGHQQNSTQILTNGSKSSLKKTVKPFQLPEYFLFCTTIEYLASVLQSEPDIRSKTGLSYFRDGHVFRMAKKPQFENPVPLVHYDSRTGLRVQTG